HLKQKEGDLLGEGIQSKNLFVDLAEHIALTLNVTSCWVCGGPITTEEWPRRGTAFGPMELLKRETVTERSYGKDRPEGWILSSLTIGRDCIERKG
ncbi:ENR1 protein, partial [Formicarius rufipectus]|nr:ENR1 protein [Formicarius rufipectus]